MAQLDPRTGNRTTLNLQPDEEIRVRIIEAEEAVQERQDQWAKRADVLNHFFGYRYFDRSLICLDLLNFSDADMDSFNLTAHKARGLNNWHVFAEYLKNYEPLHLETNTYRRKFIYHVRDFNKGQPIHSRFYLRNLTPDDVEYIENLSKQENPSSSTGVERQTMLIWATSCVEDAIRADDEDEYHHRNLAANHVEIAVEKCLRDHQDKVDLQARETVLKIREEVAKHFEQMSIDDAKGKVQAEKKTPTGGSPSSSSLM